MDNSLEEKIKELRKGYVIKLKDIISGLKILLTNEKIDIEEIYSKVHTISGTSGMYGLNDVSNISTEFEIYLKNLRNDNSLINELELHEMLLKYIESIDDILTGE